jgi:hypothetical protein
MKLTDKAIFGMVSESPGHNASEPTGSLDTNSPEAEPFPSRRRQHGLLQPGRGGRSFRRGGRGSTVTRACQATGEAVLVPLRNRRREVSRITALSGKSAEDETVAAGFVVAVKRSNVRGAKGPCCT